MSSRKSGKKSEKKLRTISHFETKTPDEIRRIPAPPSFDAPVGRRWSSRLTWSQPISNAVFDPDYLQEIMELQFNRDIVYFLDANMFINPTDDRIWKALFARNGRIAITESVLDELRFWLDSEPSCNEIAHTALQWSLNGARSSPIQIIWLPRAGTPEYVALEYYATLLGLRKRGYQFAAKRLQQQGGHSFDRQTVSNACRNIFGERTQRMAKEMRDDTLPVSLTDEALIVQALQWSLFTRSEVTIMTRDEGVLEQFYKAVWLFDTHYRGLLMGRVYSNDNTSFAARKVTANDCKTDWGRSTFEQFFAEPEITLLQLPSVTLKELLPKHFEMISWHCNFLIGDRVTQLSFAGEVEMQRVFEVKGCTGGLTSPVLDPRNIHVWIGPLTNEFGRCGAIARDRCIDFETCRIAELDVVLSLYCKEGISIAVAGDHPDFKDLPPLNKPR
jgi:hypothetical protein